MKKFTDEEIREIIREEEQGKSWRVDALIPIESEDAEHVANRINEDFGIHNPDEQFDAEAVNDEIDSGFITFGDGYALLWYDGV